MENDLRLLGNAIESGDFEEVSRLLNQNPDSDSRTAAIKVDQRLKSQRTMVDPTFQP